MMHDPFDLDHFDDSFSEPEAPSAAAPVPNSPSSGPPSKPAYFDGLNAPQREAVENIDGPLLVLAGAGTGKTRVLTSRITHILATGKAFPAEILAVTFTNKAAKEMQNRVARMINRPVEGMPIGTFHSIAARFLRYHAELVGLESNYTILDTDDQLRLLKQLIKEDGIDDKRWPAKHMAALIDRWKNKAMTPERVPEGESFAYGEGKGKHIYTLYQARLKAINACDFGDLLLHNILIFQKHPDVLARYHNRFKYILVDEYQDTNVAQYMWLRLLAQASKNICCVGDDDQSIYGWRGAEVGNILKFDADFPGAKIIRLEQNYRSTPHILGAASGLIEANSGRLGKTLWTDEPDGDKVQVQGVWDSKDEVNIIATEVENLQSKAVSLNEVSILVRASSLMLGLETKFLKLGIPYRIVGGPKFWQRKECRDLLAYLRVINQPNDDLAFERIINLPKRGLGPGALQKIHTLRKAHEVSMTRAASQIVDLGHMKGKAALTLKGLMTDFERWRNVKSDKSQGKLAEQVLEESGYITMWREDKSPDAAGRLENLSEAVGYMNDYDNLETFLEHIALILDNDANTTSDKVSIMTLHAAKGLEFDHVFLPGWEEGVFPSQMTLDESGTMGLEEERRLAYVGITRARKNVHILYASSRQIFGQWQTQLPSRFIDELPNKHVNHIMSSGIAGAASRSKSYYSGWKDDDVYQAPASSADPWDKPIKSGYDTPGWGRAKEKGIDLSNRRTRVRNIEAEKTRAKKRAKAAHVSNFAIGERVFHDKFGYGLIEDIDGSKLEVTFEDAGPKKIMDSFVTRASDVASDV
jgi:DNA helicase-2/ATP-dependent DNA helicase PcrA